MFSPRESREAEPEPEQKPSRRTVGERCQGGGHRDEWGFCKFTEEDRAELRRLNRW
jgi:hypothetical protein